jgi:hypothetical protein
MASARAGQAIMEVNRDLRVQSLKSIRTAAPLRVIVPVSRSQPR